jgi:TRAP-type uncharacterized transport system substrate-binding protein
VQQMYPEYVHLLCGAESGVDDVYDLVSSNGVGVGSEFSGNTVIWKNMGKQDKSLAEIPTMPAGLDSETALAINNGDFPCTLQVAGLGAQAITNFANIAEGVVLTEFDGRKFDDMQVTVNGKTFDLYTRAEIPGGTYPKSIQPGMFSSTVDTMSVPSVLVINAAWRDGLPKDVRTRLFDGINRAMKSVKKTMGS